MKKSQGFTIIELLIVIVVIGILAALVLGSFSSAQAKARDAQRLSDMRSIVNALEVYRANNNGVYPGAIATANASGWEVSTNGSSVTNFLAALVPSGFADRTPVDPSNRAGTPTNLNPLWSGDNYMYFYHYYAAGASGCDSTRGNFYVLGVTRLETVPSGQSHSGSPGFQCSTRNWAPMGAWVTGRYVND